MLEYYKRKLTATTDLWMAAVESENLTEQNRLEIEANNYRTEIERREKQ